MLKYFLYAILFTLLLSLVGFYLGMRPFRVVSTVTPENYSVKYESVQFRTSDNILLKGWFIPSKNPQAKTIILLHGYPADKGNILPTRLFLHQHYNLLFVDFRYLGESGGHYSTVGSDEVRDVRAAVDYLHTRGIHEAAVWGLSMGGAVALMAVKDAPEIKAVVAEKPYARLEWLANKRYPIPGLNWIIGQLFRMWGYIFLQVDISNINPMEDAAHINIPLLLLYSNDDELITHQHAAAMKEAVKDNLRVTIMIENGKGHNDPMDNYEEVVGGFFAKYFPPRAD